MVKAGKAVRASVRTMTDPPAFSSILEAIHTAPTLPGASRLGPLPVAVLV